MELLPPHHAAEVKGSSENAGMESELKEAPESERMHSQIVVFGFAVKWEDDAFAYFIFHLNMHLADEHTGVRPGNRQQEKKQT